MSDFGRGALLSVCAALFAATFLIPYKAAGDLAPRDAVVPGMLLCAAVINTVVALVRHRNALSWDRVTMIAALILAVMTALGNIAVSEALSRLDPGMTSVLQQTQILFVAALGSVFLSERITARFLIGVMIALAGFSLMHLPGAVESGAAIRITGMLWAVGSAVAFAIMHVVTRKVIHQIKPVWVNSLRLWMSVAILICIPGQVSAMSEMDVKPWLLCAVAAFVGPFLGRVTIMHAVRFITAAQSLLVALVSPLFAFTLGFFAFGARPTLLEVAGAAIILAGIALPIVEIVQSQKNRPARSK